MSEIRLSGRPRKVPKRGNYFHTVNPEGLCPLSDLPKVTKQPASARVHIFNYVGMLGSLEFGAEGAATFRILET